MIAVAPTTPQERMLLWRALFPAIRALALFLAPVRVEGVERIPNGAAILVANHASWKDPPWLAFALDRAVRYMAKSELFDVPFLGGVIRQTASFPVRRGESDRRAVVTALRVLEAGLPLGLFPEGHRSESGGMIRAHPGVALIAMKSGAPVVPIGIVGSRQARLGRFWRRDILVRVGQPFHARDLGLTDEREATDAIMRRVAALLPPEMRGVYA